MGQRVAVLGGTGYVGQTLVPALVAAGHEVIVIARRAPTSLPQGAMFVACDACDRRALTPALADAEQIVNAVTGEPATIVQVARNLAECASYVAGQNDIRFVQISSLAVFGQTSGMLDEATLPVPARQHRYAAAKLCAETILQADSQMAGRCAILRPGCVYGEGAPVWTNRIGRLLLSGRLGSLGREGCGWCIVIHVADLANAVCAALSSGREMAGVHHLVAPDPVTWNEYFRRFGGHLGLRSLPCIGWPQLAAETWLATPFAHARTRLRQPCPDVISTSMRRVFRNRGMPIHRRRALLQAAAFRALDNGLADAARPLLYHNDLPAATHRHTAPSWANAT
jgi:nucleoside-diphosphate-sugar epimerase